MATKTVKRPAAPRRENVVRARPIPGKKVVTKTTPPAKKSTAPTNAQLAHDLVNLESQIGRLQTSETTNARSEQAQLADQAGTLSSLGSGIDGSNGTSAPTTDTTGTSTGGILSGLSGASTTTKLIAVAVAGVVGYFGWRYYKSRGGAK